jgi:lysophospholipase L1-like esterase
VTTIVLFGDSMLGRYTRPRIELLEHHLGPEVVVVNCAAGGWTSADGLRRAELVARIRPDVVVLSFGANDCRPDRRVEREDFAANLAAITAAFGPTPAVGFLPPSLVETDGVGLGGRTNADLAGYRALLAAAVAGQVLDTDAALESMPTGGTSAHEEDGLHLTGEAYRLVTPVLADVVREIVANRPRRVH